MNDLLEKYRYNFPGFVNEIIYKESGWVLADFHKELMNIVSNNIDNRYVTFMLPRGHLKTWLFSICYPIWRMVIEKNFETVLVSSSIEQSMKTLGITQQLIKDIPSLKFLIPNGREDKWNQHQLNTSNRNQYYVKPFNSTGRGIHVNLAIFDDLLREGDISPDQIKDIFWNVFYPTVQNKKGQDLFIGTPQTPDDLLMELQTKEKFSDWKRRRMSAVILDDKGNWLRPLWKENFTLKELESIREKMGPYRFSREYMCMPETIGSRPFPMETILDCCDDNLKFNYKTEGQVFIGCDLASSTGKYGDYSVYIVVDVINGTYEKKTKRKDGTLEKTIINNPIIIKRMERYKGLLPQVQRERIKLLYESYRDKASRVVVDESQWGASMITDLQREFVPAVGEDFQSKHRREMIVNLRRIFDERRIIIPTSNEDFTYNQTKFLIEELSKMRLRQTAKGNETYQVISGHDDCIMALALAVKSALLMRGMPSKIIYSAQDKSLKA